MKRRLRTAVALAASVLLVACGSPSMVKPGPTASPDPTATAPPSAEPVELGRVPWISFERLWNANDQPQPQLLLLAGWIGEATPSLEVVAPFAFLRDPMEYGHQPAVAALPSGLIVYVGDDGVTSTVHRTSVDGEDIVISELPEIVWSLALAPDGTEVYLLLLHRADYADAGVARVPIDGGEAQSILEPAQPAAASAAALAAVLPYTGRLVPSLEGALLARETCAGEGGLWDCRLDILDLATGHVGRLEDDIAGHLIGLTHDWVVAVPDCGAIGCPTIVVDLARGTRAELPIAVDGLELLVVEGDPILVATAEMHDRHSYAIEATTLTSGETRVVLQSGPGAPVFMPKGSWWTPLLPSGWVEVYIEGGRLGERALHVPSGTLVHLQAPSFDRHPQAVPG